jgi:hypothetical protein
MSRKYFLTKKKRMQLLNTMQDYPESVKFTDLIMEIESKNLTEGQKIRQKVI